MAGKDKSYATPTEKLLLRLISEPNPVTRAVLAQIIGRRVDASKDE